MGDFIRFTAFHWRDVHDAGDFMCLAREREKPCPDGRLPLNAGELTAQQCGHLWTITVCTGFYVVTFGSYNNSLPYVTIKMMAAAQAWTKCRNGT